jgi:OOP family OmpA-OmpF porin
MNRILLLGLLALVLLCALCTFCRAPAIQEDIQERASAELKAAGYDDAMLSVDGRDIILAGTVASEEERSRVGEIAASVYGRANVTNRLQVVAPPVMPAAASAVDGRLELIKEGPMLTLRGTVPSEAARDDLVSRAEGVWGEGHVVDELTVDPTVGPLPAWMGDVTDAMHLRRGDLAVTLAGTTATIEGEVLSDLTEERILGTAEALLPGFDVVDRIEIVEPADDLEKLQHSLDTMLRGKVVEFDLDRAELTAAGQAVLDQVIVTLKEYPGKVVISGHTDSRASQEYNIDLSNRRAETVEAYLVANGLDADRFETRGYGETRPIATNETEEGQQRNRRTEFQVPEEE